MHELLLGIGKELPFVPPAVEPGNPFRGFVKSSDLVDGKTLAELISLSAGTVINNDAGWLHFVDGANEFYIARKPIRYGVTGASMTASSQRTGKTVVIGTKRFRVRMMSGMASDPFNSIIGIGDGGEWNKYMYPIYAGADKPASEVWSYYTAPQLGLTDSVGVAALAGISLCRDLHSSIANAYAGRGFNYPGTGQSAPIVARTVINDASPSEGNGGRGVSAYGWRPMLEYLGDVIIDPDSGPGPITIVSGDKQAGYYGVVSISEFFTGEQIDAASATPITGTAANRTVQDLWHKFSYKGRTLFIPRTHIRSGMTWNNLYLHGLMYGTDDNGKSQTGGTPGGFNPIPLTPTNQMRVIQKTAADGTIFKFKVKAPSTVLDDPSINWGNSSSSAVVRAPAQASEWGQTIERTIPTAEVDSVWASTGQYSPMVCIEAWNITDGQAYFIRPLEQSSATWGGRSQASKSPAAGYAWVPVVELIEVIKP